MQGGGAGGVNTKRVVSDNGSGYVKLGFGGDSFPRYVMPSIIGRPMLRASEKVGNVDLKELMVCDEAAPLRSYLEIKYPLIEGQIKNWDDMEHIWNYCFHTKLKLPQSCTEHQILLTEPAKNPVSNRQKMGEIMFEKYDFGGVMFEYQALLTLMAEGNTTGAVLDAGDGVSHVIPVFEGLIQSHCIGKLNIAGRHVTEYLIKLLMYRGYAFNSSADFETCREIKEAMCYVSINLPKERIIGRDTTVVDKEYKLPDGTTILIGRERFEAPEILMNPALIESESLGLPEMVYKSITDCDLNIQKALVSNIWLSGGTSMIPGLSSRLEMELKNLYLERKFKGDAKGLDRIKIQVHDPPRRKNAVFMGASFFAQFAQDHQYISKQEYQEKGPTVFQRRA